MRWGLVLILLVACDLQNKKWSDPAFDPVVEGIKEKYGVTITSNIFFGNSPDDKTKGVYVSANCFINSNIIIVDKEVWKKHTLEQNEALLLHEAGHCMNSLKHNDEEIDGMPISLMNYKIGTYSLTVEQIKELVEKDFRK